MKNMMNPFLACAVFMACMIPVSAKDTETAINHPYKEDVAVLVEQFKELGIEEDTAEELTDKYLSGEQLDCMNEKYSKMEPLEVIESEGFYKALYEYPDGSRKLVSITAGITQYISGGTYNSGGNWYTWNNALVYGSFGVISVSFRANMAGSAYDGHLTSMSNLYVSGGSVTQNAFGISIVHASASVPAKGGFSGIVGLTSVSLYLYVPMGGSPYAVFSC